MAPLPVIDNVYRVAFNWSTTGSNAVNVMHFRGPNSQSDFIEALIGQFELAGGGLWACTSASASIKSLSVTALDGESATALVPVPDTSPWIGEGSGDYFPQGSALVKLNTNRRGRSYRGRVYTPYASEGAFADGIMNATPNFENMQTAWTTLKTGVELAGLDLVVASYKEAEATDVSSVAVELSIATQRRRNKRLA